MTNSNSSVRQIFSIAGQLRKNKSNEIDHVGQVLLLNGKPAYVCKSELAASFLSHSLESIRYTSDTQQLMKLSLLVIRINQEQNLGILS